MEICFVLRCASHTQVFSAAVLPLTADTDSLLLGVSSQLTASPEPARKKAETHLSIITSLFQGKSSLGSTLWNNHTKIKLRGKTLRLRLAKLSVKLKEKFLFQNWKKKREKKNQTKKIDQQRGSCSWRWCVWVWRNSLTWEKFSSPSSQKMKADEIEILEMSVLFITFCRVKHPLAGTRRCKLTCSQFDALLGVWSTAAILWDH